ELVDGQQQEGANAGVEEGRAAVGDRAALGDAAAGMNGQVAGHIRGVELEAGGSGGDVAEGSVAAGVEADLAGKGVAAVVERDVADGGEAAGGDAADGERRPGLLGDAAAGRYGQLAVDDRGAQDQAGGVVDLNVIRMRR